jgi:hypothetical protein
VPEPVQALSHRAASESISLAQVALGGEAIAHPIGAVGDSRQQLLGQGRMSRQVARVVATTGHAVEFAS